MRGASIIGSRGARTKKQKEKQKKQPSMEEVLYEWEKNFTPRDGRQNKFSRPLTAGQEHTQANHNTTRADELRSRSRKTNFKSDKLGVAFGSRVEKGELHDLTPSSQEAQSGTIPSMDRSQELRP